MSSRLKRILERDEWQCRMPVCLAESRQIEDLEDLLAEWAPSVDHILPKALGGRNHDSNLRAAHRKCNEFASKAVSRKLNQDAKMISRLRRPPVSDVYDRIRQAERDGKLHRGPQGGLLENPEDVLGGKWLAERMNREKAS